MTTRSRGARPGSPIVAVLTLLALVGVGWAYPKPSAVITRWQLEFEPGPLRLFVDPVDNEVYWYFTYVVTNETGRDQIWAPSFVLYTDVGEILTAGAGVPTRVEQSIRNLLGNPLLETQTEVIGEILQGKEHARDGLAVWPARDTSVNELSLFIGGVSGETARVINPITLEQVILRKTVQRDYLIPGNALALGDRPVELAEERWVMR
jgi:hypothetical protein